MREFFPAPQVKFLIMKYVYLDHHNSEIALRIFFWEHYNFIIFAISLTMESYIDLGIYVNCKVFCLIIDKLL